MPRPLAWILLLLCLAACASPSGASSPSPNLITGPSVRFDAPQGDQGFYATAPLPPSASADAKPLAESIRQIGASRGITLQQDGRLDTLAQWIGAHVDAEGNPPPMRALDFACRSLGIPDPLPLVVVTGANVENSWQKGIGQWVDASPTRSEFNRFGAAVVPAHGALVHVAVLLASRIDLQPLPRSIKAGAPIPLRLRVHAPYHSPRVVITSPGGAVKEGPRGSTSDLSVTLATTAVGPHKVEVLAMGPHGDTVILNVPVYVGEPAPTSAQIPILPAGNDAARTPEQIGERLLLLLNQSRKEAGVPPLQMSAALSRIAADHSKDMADNGFVGHTSPTTGNASDRVKRAGLHFPMVAENVGRGSSADEIHLSLLDSPGHRGNLVHPKLTHVGIGIVVREKDGVRSVFATQLFAQMGKPIDVSRAPNDLLTMINAKRKSMGAPPLELDASLSELCRRGALRFFQDPKLSQEGALTGVVEQLSAASKEPNKGPWARIRKAESYFAAAATLDDTQQFVAAFDRDTRYIGIGVAQGTRTDTGPDTIGIVMVVGWPKK